MENDHIRKRRKFFHVAQEPNQHGSENRSRIHQQRCNLPIYSAKSKLVQELRKTHSAIIIGETGSGKTTQTPQYLLEAGFAKGKTIACTQPRRVAATTISARVAEEMGVELGEEVGYSVRFDDTTSHKTKIKYMTDGMLLRESILDPYLSRYSVVILDEAHERTVNTDVLFGIVKAAQSKRQRDGKPSLRIIIMSATMDVDHFSSYFNNSPVLYLQGRQHPIQLMYSSDLQSDYIHSALVAIFQIHRQYPQGEDILVFMTGQEEIEGVIRAVRDVAKELPSDVPGLVVCPLYAALPPHLQMKAFQSTPHGKRKVIVSTNIAETSVTIPGIKHVIDTGKVKTKTYQPGSGIDILKIQWVSQAQAWQRTGRAGREDSGTCWRLYTEAFFAKLPANTVPEIQRCNLANVVLQLLALKITDVMTFDFMDPPSKEALLNAMEQLKLLGAIEDGPDNKPVLRPLGKDMVAFPLDPRLSKVILSARNFGCLEEILTIVSILSVESIFQAPPSKREQSAAALKKFTSTDGDHLMLLNAYRSYKAAKGNKDWCLDNFINMRNVKLAQEIRKQLRELCIRAELPLSSCGHDTSAVRKCLVQGFFMSTAELQADGSYMTLDCKQTVSIHPSSCLFQCKPAYVLYNETVQTSKSYIRNVSAVNPEWLYEVAPNYFRKRFSKR